MSSQVKLTVRQQDEIVRRYRQESANQLAREYGCSHGAVVSLLTRRGVYRPRRFQGFTPEDREAIFASYRSGSKPSEIARRFRCSQGTVERMLQRYKVWVPPTALERVGSRYTLEQKQEMARMYQAGESIYKIGKSFQANPQLIWKILRAAGVEFRDNAWKGGRVRNNGGYVALHADPDDPIAQAMATVTGYVLEHRLVMAHSLGRPLERHETVHHINGDVTDNRLQNLQLRNGKHGKGVALACLDCGSHNVGPVPLN